MHTYIRQRGFLVVGAIVLAVVVGLIAATVAYLYSTSGDSSANESMSTQALYVASAGLERGLKAVANVNTGSRVACGSFNGNAQYTNFNFDAGQFTVTSTTYNPAAVTLSAAVNASATIIPVSSVTNFSPSGSITIGSEMIDYGSKGTSSSECGGVGTNCFLSAKRGAGGTTAAAYSSGASVTQDMCYLQSTGYVPSQSNALASRTLVQAVVFAGGSVIWAVGDDHQGELIYNWNGSNWVRESASSGIPDVDLNGVYFTSATNAWAVGDENSSVCGSSADAVILRYNGTNWSRVCSTNVNYQLQDVHCVNASNCWAVGERSTIARYNGSSWFDDSRSGSFPNVYLNGVYMASTSHGWAVGDRANNSVFFAFYNGSQWTRQTIYSVTDQNYNDVFCTATTNCWAVGDGGAIARWNGSSWQSTGFTKSGIGSDAINSLHCISQNLCWAVGAKIGSNPAFYLYDGPSNTWSRYTSGVSGAIPNDDLLHVFCPDQSSCWAVGDNTAAYWNGSTWALSDSGIPNNHNLNAVGGYGSGGGGGSGGTARILEWKEIFN